MSHAISGKCVSHSGSKMISVKNFTIGKIKDQGLLYIFLAGTAMLYFGKAQPQRERSIADIALTGGGALVLIFGCVYVVVVLLKGEPSNSQERLIESGMIENIQEDRRRRGVP